jgi:peptide/nickel transport system substrate-binding protein
MGSNAFSRRELLRLASYTTAATLLAGCQVGTGGAPTTSPAAGSTTKKRGGTVIVAAKAVGTLENSLNLGVPTPRYLYEIYDRLLYEDLSAEAEAPPFVPGLATSWDISSDATVYTFKLRQGVSFHDGTPFDADAVKFNIERLSKRDHPFYYERGAGATAIGWGRIAQIDVVDKYTIRLRLKAPYSQLTDLLARAEYSIASPENIKRLGNDKVGESPVGTGPFKFVSHQSGVKLTLERNANYWGEPPLIDQIVVRVINEPAAAVSALLAGEVHLVGDNVSADVAKSLETNPNVKIRVRKTPGTVNATLNMRSGPTADKRVRQALNYALDRDAYVDKILKGFGAPEKAFFAPSAIAFNRSLKGYTFDPEKAKALLREAGVTGGINLTIRTAPDALADATTYMKDQLAKVNVNVKVEVVEFATLAATADREGTTAEVAGLVAGWNTNPPFNFDRFFYSRFAPPNGVNWGFYNNPEVDKLIDQAGRTVDSAERIRIYQRAEEIIVEDAPWLVLHHGPFTPMAGVKNLYWVAANAYNYTLRNAYFTE